MSVINIKFYKSFCHYLSLFGGILVDFRL